MAELTRAPKPRTEKIEVLSGTKMIERKAIDLDDVIRGVIIEYRDEHDISTRECAHRLGLKQQTLSGFLDENGTGARVKMLSNVCAAMRVTPAQFFERHDLYSRTTVDDDDWIWDLKIAAKNIDLDRDSRDRLTKVIELAVKLDLADVLIAQAYGFVNSVSETKSSVEKPRRRGARGGNKKKTSPR